MGTAQAPPLREDPPASGAPPGVPEPGGELPKQVTAAVFTKRVPSTPGAASPRAPRGAATGRGAQAPGLPSRCQAEQPSSRRVSPGTCLSGCQTA